VTEMTWYFCLDVDYSSITWLMKAGMCCFRK